MDNSGNIYGTTIGHGGTDCNNGRGCGVVFKLVPQSQQGKCVDRGRVCMAHR